MNDELQQSGLFDGPQPFPHGLLYRPDFITRAEEGALLAAIAPLPLREARFREYFAKRRVVHFHASADAPKYEAGEEDSFSSGLLPPFLTELLDKVAKWV